MSAIQTFEALVASQDFDSSAAMLEFIKQSPLGPQYVFEMMVARRVKTYTPDGWLRTVRGNAAAPGANLSKPWSLKIALKVDVMKIFSGNKEFNCKAVQEALNKANCMTGEGLPIGHWAAFHALSRLVAGGELVREANGKYRLTGTRVPAAAIDWNEFEGEVTSADNLPPYMREIVRIWNAGEWAPRIDGLVALLAKNIGYVAPGSITVKDRTNRLAGAVSRLHGLKLIKVTDEFFEVDAGV